MIRLTKRGLLLTSTQDELDRLRTAFEKNHYLILPQLIEPELFDALVSRVENAPFVERKHGKIAQEVCMNDPGALLPFSFLTSNPSFLRLVEFLTEREKIGGFLGRVYRRSSSEEHFDNWHSDSSEKRMAVMSINLTRKPFQGGALQIKNRDNDEILANVRNTGFGDALIFRISKTFLHRVGRIEGDLPRTAFAGWFMAGEDWISNRNE